MKRFFTLASLTIFAIVLATIPASAMTSEEFIELLTAKKWSGSQRPANPSPRSTWQGGNLELEFFLADGKLAGKIVKATGTTWPMDGTPLSNIKISIEGPKPSISFQSVTGTSFNLALENGNLSGEAWGGSNRNLVNLRAE